MPALWPPRPSEDRKTSLPSQSRCAGHGEDGLLLSILHESKDVQHLRVAANDLLLRSLVNSLTSGFNDQSGQREGSLHGFRSVHVIIHTAEEKGCQSLRL